LNPGSFAYDSSNVYQTFGENHFVPLGPVLGSQITLPVESVTTVVLDHYGPVAPTGLSATMILNSQINLTWTAAPSATSYNIKRSTTAGGPYTVIPAVITGTSFCDISAAPGQTYYYVVSSNTPGGESANSGQATPSRVRTYLKFNETGGVTASDATGNGRNGTLVNGPLWTEGKFGNAVDLDGTNDHVTLPAGVVNGLTNFTIAAWVNLDTVSNWSRIFDFGTGTTVNMFLTPRSGQTGPVRFAITTGGPNGEQRISGTAALPSGAWTHVAVTLNGTTGVLYVNGAEVGRNNAMSLTPSSLGNTTQNYIGRSQYSADPYINGRVDEFRIYNTALSAANVAALYTEQIPAAIPSTPTGLSATTISGSRIDLAWNASSGTTNYNVKRSATDGGPYTIVAGVSGTSYSDTGLPEKTAFYYVVSAVNNAGQCVNSTQAEAATHATPPAAPTSLTAAAGDCMVSLTWDANTESDLAGYNVYRSMTPGIGYALQNASLLNSPEFTDSDVGYYTTYYYVVTAVDTDGLESAYADEVSAMSNDSRAVQLAAADFESGFGDWVNISGEDSHDWIRQSGGTLTPNTGPSGGANGSDWYVYLETSPGYANLAGNSTILESPVIKGFARILTFYYHMYGVDTGTLNVDVYDGTWHTAEWSLSGQQHTSVSQAYTQVLVDLRRFTGPIQIRIRAAAAGGPRGDMAIDEIEVRGRVLYGDMNGDNIVDAEDLQDFSGFWLLDDCAQDLNGDCLIGLYEFAEFAGNWLDASFQ
jgi:fibronectin type 3 domain-containing protein